MTGEAAREAYELASRLVKEGKYDEALAVPMLESDRVLIQQRIDYAKTTENK